MDLKKLARRIVLALGLVLAAGSSYGQQAQTQTAPIYPVNAKYTQGTSPGYWPTPGTGLVLNIAAGRVRCVNTMINFAGGTLTLTNNTTNYVYLDVASSCIPAFNTSGYTAGVIAIATVTTSGGVITGIFDDRTLGISTPMGGSGTGVTGTGSPVSGNLVKWSGVASITNGDLSGDCTTSGTLATNCSKINGTSFSGTSTHLVAFGASNTPADSGIVDTAAGLLSACTGCAPLASPALTGTPTAPTPSADDGSTKVATTAYADTYKIRSFGTTFGDTGGSALTNGSVVYFTISYACTITAWNITVDAGTVTFDIWKIATGTAIPTVTNTITASAKPALSTGTALHSTSMSGWTTSVAANDIFGIQLNTVATAKYAELDIQCNQ
jgi:hypothetical protein